MATTGAVMLVTPRAISGLFAEGTTSQILNLLAWLPHSRQPLGYVSVNGQRLPVEIDAQAWYRFFHTIAETKLGGIGGSTLPQVAEAGAVTAASAAAAASQTASVAAQAQANAEALLATVQVVTANALTGAEQIPPVRMTSQGDIP